jgi:hypothetical protein
MVTPLTQATWDQASLTAFHLRSEMTPKELG